MNKLFPGFIAALLFLSCTSGKPAATTEKQINVVGESGASGASTLEITPTDAARNSVLTLHSAGFNLPEAKITWLVNDAIADDSSKTQFVAAEVVKGDLVQAKAVFKNQTIMSNTVRIGNTLPEITSVKNLPEVFKQGDRLGVEPAGSDADRDPVSYTYEWTVNGEPAGHGKQIDRPVHRGDNVIVKITPYDGSDYGNPVVVQREIRNFPPVIEGHNEFSFDGTTYTYQVRASDPDGDSLVYSLESTPTGMTIDRSTGLLKWIVPPDFRGRQTVSVIVSDGNGGNAKYDLNVSIR